MKAEATKKKQNQKNAQEPWQKKDNTEKDRR